MTASPAIDARLSIDVGRGTSSFHVDAEVAGTGVIVLFGPSGVGKTLTLQALAGLIPVALGHVRIGSETLLDTKRHIRVPTHQRRVGYVPQHQSLFPFLDVAGNVAFGLPRPLRRTERVAALLEELGIAELAAAVPSSLSGGERHRVALARCLAAEPRLLLLDEPFVSVDEEGRAGLRRVLREVIDRRAVPAIVVTHDRREALAIGDRLVRFERGRTIETGTPADLLGQRDEVTLSGVITEVDDAPGGRHRAQLRDAVVEGSADVVKRGPISLVYRPRDR
jgi:molybdate transport system ATP-binding protein